MRIFSRATINLESARKACESNVVAAEILAWTLLRRHDEAQSSGLAESAELTQAEKLCAEIRALEPRHPGVFECLTEIATLRGKVSVAEVYL